MRWILSKVELDGNKSFEIWHTLPIGGVINSFDAAVDNWRVRTDKFTQQSLIDYINSKRLKRMAPEFWASKFKPE